MGPASHQTMRLSRGKHRSPEDGACVMELASMLAGEDFGDHPTSVCPVIGSFLRSYNDAIDDDRRQDLYTYASAVVGSRGSSELQNARADRLVAWIAAQRRRRWTRFGLSTRLRALAPRPLDDMLGPHAVRAMRRLDDRAHAEALALIDDLLAIGAERRAGAVVPSTGRGAIIAPSREADRLAGSARSARSAQRPV